MILYINERQVNIFGQDRILLTKSAARFSEIDTRHSTISNEFRVSFDNALHYALGYSVNTSHTNVFTTQRQESYLTTDEGKFISRGFVQFMNFDQVEGYATIKFFSGNAEWFFALGDKLLGDLDLSDLNHDWNVAGIIGSFDNTEGYIYPMIDYGDKTFNNSLIDEITGWYPAVFQKTYIQKIFEEIGYNIDGSFLDDPVYKKTIVPFVNRRLVRSLTQQSVGVTGYMTSDRLLVPNGVESLGVGTSSVGFDPDFTDTNDPTQFDVSRDRWTATHNGGSSYSFRVISNGTVNYEVGGGLDQPGTNSIQLKWVVYNVNTGAPLASKNVHSQWNYTGNTNVSFTLNFNDVFTVFPVFPGTELEIKLELTVTNFDIGPTFLYYLDVPEVRIEANDAFPDDLQEGEEVVMSVNVPKITQRDLVRDMVIRHGLIVQTDEQAKRITFEPFRKVFRNIPLYNDWTEKVILGEVLRVDHFETIQNYGQRNTFSHTQDDGDYFVKEYNQNQKTSFGDGTMHISNEFIEDQREFYESPFAATRNIDSYFDYINIPYIPRLSYDGQSVQDVTPRLLILAGNVLLADIADGDSLASVRIGGAGGTTTFYAPWSYFYKNKNALETTSEFYDIDINLAYDRPNVPFNIDRGLLSEWYREINRTLDRPALVEVSVRLREYEFEALDFSIPVRIDTEIISGYFAIETVEEYEGFDEPTTVRLIQIR